MRRILIAGVTVATVWAAGLLVLSLAHASDPPKEAPGAAPSAAPSKPPKAGKIKFSHEARTVVACEKVMDEDKPACKPSLLEPAKSGAKVKLSPMEDGYDSAPRDSLPVELPNQVGEQSTEVKLDVGDWDLLWQGDTVVHDKFSVKAGDQFEIALKTEVGVCRLKDDQCSLDKSKRRQSVEIPTERGL